MNCPLGACEYQETDYIGSQRALLPCAACGSSPLFAIQTLRISRDMWLTKHARLTEQIVDVGLRSSRFETALRDLMELFGKCTQANGDGLIRLVCLHEEITEMLAARLNAAAALLNMEPTRIHKQGDDHVDG